MKGFLLVGALVAFSTVGFLMLTGKSDKSVKAAPISQYHLRSHQATQPKALWQEPPTIDHIKKDLNGRSIQIAGSAHVFSIAEVNYVHVLDVNGDDKATSVDVQINSDVILIQKHGVLGLRQNRTHENVSGVVRINYERQGDVWVFKSIENVDATKKLIPKIN